MVESLIYDYIKNVDPKPIKNITHIEDMIDMNPETHVTDSVNTLYKVIFEDESTSFYIQVTSTSSNSIFKANEDIVKEMFTEYYEENLKS